MVDEDYTGEVQLHLINTSDVPVKIHSGDKILQFILIPVNYAEAREITNESYERFGETARGSGGFGSTDHVGPK